MSANFLIAALVIDEKREPDWLAAREAIAALTREDFEDTDSVDIYDGVEEWQEALRGKLAELSNALDVHPELDWLRVRGAKIYLTGGMSWGDDPTSLWGAFTDLPDTVLAAAGFER